MHNNFIATEFNRLLINDILIYLIPLVGVIVWDFSDSKIVFLTSTYSIGFILFSKLSGTLIDRYNSRIVPIYTYFCYIGMILLFAWMIHQNVQNELFIFVMICLLSFVSCVLEINTSVYIPDHFLNQLTMINSHVQLMRSLVNFFSPIIAFTLSNNIMITFIVILILQFVNLCMYIKSLNRNHSDNTSQDFNTDKVRVHALKYIFSNRKLVFVVLVTMGINFSLTILTNTLVIYLVRYLKVEHTLAGVLIGLLSFGAIIGALLPKYLIKKYSFEKLIGIVNFVLSMPFILLISHSYLFFIGVFAGYLCRSFGSVLRTTVQHQVIPEKIRGKVNSTIYLFTWGTIPVAGYVASILLNYISLNTLYIIVVIIFIVSNALFMIGVKDDKDLLEI